MSMTRDFARRESVMALPSLDSVLDGYGRRGGPMDRRDMAFSFRRFTGSADLDADYDRLAAWLAPGNQMRLVYQTDSGVLWYTTASNPRIQNTVTSANNWNSGGFQDFTVTFRIRPYWTPHDPEAKPPTFAADNSETFRADDSETFLSPGTTRITASPQAVLLDATGVAGSTLPTIPDTGPFVFIVGPAGGGGTGAAALAHASGSSITSVTVTTPGANYGAPPTVIFTGGTPLVPAAAVATLGTGGAAGTVVAVTMVNIGVGYRETPSISFVDPTGGIAIQNLSVIVRDTSGAQQYLTCTLPFNLPTSNDSYSLDFASQKFLHNGVPFRPVKASYQPVYCEVKNGVVNTWNVSAVGSPAMTGGAFTTNWWKRRA
jgi:hypothetical protein